MSDANNTSPENTPQVEQPKPQPEQPSIGPVNNRLGEVQDTLTALRKRVNRSATTTAVVMTLLLLFILAYFTFGFVKINSVLEPKQLIGVVDNMIDTKLPDMRSQLEAYIEENSEVWAEQAIDQAIESIPALREQLEEFALFQTEELVDQAEVMTETQFRQILDQNRPMLEQGFQELSSSEKLSEKTLLELEDILEQQLQADMTEQAAIILETIAMLRERVERLHVGKGLDKEERLERDLLSILRRLQLEEADPSLVGKPITQIRRTTAQPETAAEPEPKPAEKKAAPKAEPKKAEPKPAPKKEVPKAEPKKAEPKPAPKAEPKKAEPKPAPKKEAPKAEPKKAEPKPVPKKEAPKAEPKKAEKKS